jgi:hypothetical protein
MLISPSAVTPDHFQAACQRLELSLGLVTADLEAHLYTATRRRLKVHP